MKLMVVTGEFEYQGLTQGTVIEGGDCDWNEFDEVVFRLNGKDWVLRRDHVVEFDNTPEVNPVKSDGGSALDKQVSGQHYKSCAIQPIQYIHANNLGYFEGNVIKYVTRYKDKNGKADLEKAVHYLELLIELEYPEGA